jgi:hypothetical protein
MEKSQAQPVESRYILGSLVDDLPISFDGCGPVAVFGCCYGLCPEFGRVIIVRLVLR